MNNRTSGVIAAIAVSALATLSAYGSPSLGYTETWTGGVSSWTTEPAWNFGGSFSVGNSSGEHLDLILNPGLDPQATGLAISPGGAGDPFSGNFAALNLDGKSLNVKFTFITTGTSATPSDLNLYFTANGREWTYNVLTLSGTPAPTGSTIYNIVIGSVAGWFGAAENYSDALFYTDLQNIDHLGLYVSSVSPQTYGLDNMGLTFIVPEPETVWMILAIVLSLAITFRSRLVDTVGQLKARYIKA